MSLATNIARRPGSANYYVRVAVPMDLQRVLNKREIWKSLGTADPKQARANAPHLLMQIHGEFAEWRRRREPTPTDLQAASWDHYRTEVEQDRQDRMALAGQAPMPPEFRARRTTELKRHMAIGETSLIAWKADDVIRTEGLLIEKGTAAYRDLCHRLQRAELEMLQRAEERDRGDWTGAPKDPDVQPPAHLVRQTAAPGESILELFDRFQRENAGKASADTWDQNRKAVKLFAEFVGETAHISAVKRRAVRDWKDALSRWPIKAAEISAFKGMSFPKVIEANAKIAKPTISPRTINKYLSALGSFAGWLLSNDFIAEDCMKGMYLALDKSEKKRLPFTTEQLKTIFASPLFRTCGGDKREHEPGTVNVRDWRYWIAPIALFTGARLGEIAQLLTDDIRQLHGHWIFHFTEEGSDEKSLKTAGSMRVVPVHSELIALGLLAYRATMARKRSARLFPEIERDTRGFVSGTPSSFFNDHFRDIGAKVDKTVNFHSFRHTFADACRRAGYLDEQFGMLLGHTKASTTGRYGIMPEGPLAERVRMIEAVAYPGLDLSPLRPK